MVGSAILNELKIQGYEHLITASRSELDLMDYHDVDSFLKSNKPNIVILAAAKVGGIQANIDNPGKFLYENLVIQNNVIHLSHLNGIKKLVFLGSSCIYPKQSPQPMKEEYLLTGKLEPTNEGYALAKIAGLKMAEAYKTQYGLDSISLMPCNLYGPNDSFDPTHSHVLSALVKRFVDATEQNTPEVILWGTGIARREFLHVNDMAKATLFMLENYHSSDFINIGCGEDISIKELANMIAQATNYQGEIKWDADKPNGMLRKCMDVSRMKAIGFEPTISLQQGVNEMITIYKNLKTNKQ
ncbi:GDP-L-fucose synthase [compost metagenome]